jgi:hypothetical protein
MADEEPWHQPGFFFARNRRRFEVAETASQEPQSNAGLSIAKGVRRSPLFGGGLNRSMQHFILKGKDGVWDGTEIS